MLKSYRISVADKPLIDGDSKQKAQIESLLRRKRGKVTVKVIIDPIGTTKTFKMKEGDTLAKLPLSTSDLSHRSSTYIRDKVVAPVVSMLQGAKNLLS